MSGLNNSDCIGCQNCGTEMIQILLCINKSVMIGSENKKQHRRCHNIICKDCEYCIGCRKRIEEMKDGLRKCRYGRKDENMEGCKWYLNELKHNHCIDIKSTSGSSLSV